LFSRYFPPAVAKVYIVSFRTHNDRQVEVHRSGRQYEIRYQPGVGGMEGPDFQSRFDKSTGQAQEMKEGVLRVQ
jgi:hypothetical protein